MKAPVPTEAQEQAAFIQWLELTARADPRLYFATVGHGGFKLDRATAGRLKGMGLRAGTPDVIGCFKGRFWAVEMKRQKGGQLSESQRETHRRILLAGGVVFVAKGAGAAIEFIKESILAGG